jgi:hypothetical protein
MLMKKTFLLITLLVLPMVAAAQSAPPTPTKFSPGSILPVELSKALDARKAHAGDPVLGKVPYDLSSNGKVVVPHDTKVVGHVAEAKPSDHDSKESMLGIVFDKLILKDGTTIPVTAEIQAVGAPVSSAQAAYSDNSPSETNPAGTNQRSEMEIPRPPNPTAPQAEMPSESGAGRLSSKSQGIVGLRGYSLSQGSMQDSVIGSTDHNVKLESGTQIMLRTK